MYDQLSTINCELTNGIATVWLNRPDVHNALNQQMILEIIECFNALGEDINCRIIILRGKGKSFCAGADLNYMKGIATFGFEENYNDSLKLAKCFNTIYKCKKPTIAIIHGAAVGGANGLLAACDFVIADTEARFAFSEVKLGIAPATISPYVFRRIGEYNSRELMITGRRITGTEAEKYHLANIALPANEIEPYLTSLVETIMTSGPEAISATKNLIYNISNKLNFEESIDYTARLIAELRASKEGQEGMASFLEKRKPFWVK